MDSCIVAGLGNPGPRYTGTRHNLGFRVLDLLEERWGVRMDRRPGPALAGRATIGGIEVVLLKPMTFMNNSGIAVAAAAGDFGVSPGRILVVVDDFALPLGTLRIRPRGTDGGHNGLASVIGELGTQDVPRLRLGIAGAGAPSGPEMVQFVLSPFAPEEEDQVRALVARAADACQLFAERGTAEAMNRCNTATPPTGPFASEP